MKQGLFITVEGVDGSGKSTQLRLLQTYLEQHAAEMVFTREPGGCVISEEIRKIILSPQYATMHARTEALLYAAARAQHVQEMILPALQRGAIVLCDRFLDSSLAYQAYGRGLPQEEILQINRFAMNTLTPDLTLFYYLSAQEAARRRTLRAEQADRLESAGDAFAQRVAQGYLALAKEQPARIHTIHADGSIEETFEKTRKVLQPYLERFVR